MLIAFNLDCVCCFDRTFYGLFVYFLTNFMRSNAVKVEDYKCDLKIKDMYLRINETSALF